MNLLPGISTHMLDTDRLRMRYLESGPSDGIPVVLIHGNLATSRFYEHVMSVAPERYRCIAPDMRGFGNTARVPIDATRGLRDWSDDTFSLVRALGITRPVHLVGWSTGGAAIGNYAEDRPVASLTFVDPVSPYGFGGVHVDGTPCFPDYAGSGGGTGNPDFTQRIAWTPVLFQKLTEGEMRVTVEIVHGQRSAVSIFGLFAIQQGHIDIAQPVVSVQSRVDGN